MTDVHEHNGARTGQRRYAGYVGEHVKLPRTHPRFERSRQNAPHLVVTLMGVNHVGAEVVDLSGGELDLARRAQAVDATLRVRRRTASSRRELTRLELIDLLPSRVYRARFGGFPSADPAAPTQAHTTLTSIRCEPTAEWSLLGRPFRFAGMLPPVYPDIGLAQAKVLATGWDSACVVMLSLRTGGWLSMRRTGSSTPLDEIPRRAICHPGQGRIPHR